MSQLCLRYRNRRLASPKETLLLTKECEFKSALVEFRFYNSFLSLKNAVFYKRIFS